MFQVIKQVIYNSVKAQVGGHMKVGLGSYRTWEAYAAARET